MGILTSGHCDVKLTLYIKFLDESESKGLKITLSAKFELDQVITLKIILVSLFIHPKKLCDAH